MSDVMEHGQGAQEPQDGPAEPDPAAPPPRPGLPIAPPVRPEVGSRLLPSETAEIERPPAVNLAYWLWFAAVLAAMVTCVLALTHWDSLHDDMALRTREEYPDESQSTVDQVATAALAVLIGGGALFATVQLLLALSMRKGRNWARYGLVVLGLLSLILAALTAGTVPSEVQFAMLVACALLVAAAVAMFVPEASEWFRQRKDYSPFVGEEV